MVVFSNHRLGASAELLVSEDVASAMLRATASEARPIAEARWELELVRWLDSRGPDHVDVGDIAWTPDHFDAQRRFLVDAIARAATGSEHGAALDRWRRMIEAHPRDAIHRRRWQWPSNNHAVEARDADALRDTADDAADRAGSSPAPGHVGTPDLPLDG